MRARQAYEGSVHRRKDKHAEGPLSTKGPRHARPSAKNGKKRVRRWDKRAQKAVEKRGRDAS